MFTKPSVFLWIASAPVTLEWMDESRSGSRVPVALGEEVNRWSKGKTSGLSSLHFPLSI